jgi:hypothetical protein
MRVLFENSDAIEMPVAMPGVLSHLKSRLGIARLAAGLPVLWENGSSDQPEREEIHHDVVTRHRRRFLFTRPCHRVVIGSAPTKGIR